MGSVRRAASARVSPCQPSANRSHPILVQRFHFSPKANVRLAALLLPTGRLVSIGEINLPLSERKVIMKKFLASTAVLAAIVAGSIGVANAQSSSTPPSTVASTATANAAKSPNGVRPVRGINGRGFSAHADTIAKALGMTTADLQTAVQSGKSIATLAKEKGVDVQKIIAVLVAEEQSEHPEMSSADITQRVTDRVNGIAPTGGPMGGHMGGERGGPGGGFRAHADTIAKALGVTTTDLQSAMQSGSSIATLAKEKGVDVQKVIAAFVAEEQAEHPQLTGAEVTQRVTDRVNGVAPTGGRMGGPRGGRGQRPANIAGANQTPAVSTASTTAV